jgi:hypothetical protein
VSTAYGAASGEEQSETYEGLLAAVEHRRTIVPVIKPEHFRKGQIVVKPDEVFVSVVTRDGDTVSIIAVGPDGHTTSPVELRARPSERPTHAVTRSNDTDWSSIVGRYSAGCMAAQKAQEETLPLEDPDIVQLCQTVVRTAMTANPSMMRVCLHTDAFLRVVPWQLLLRSVLQDFVRGLLSKARASGERRVRRVEDQYLDLLVCHVSGIHPVLSDQRMRTSPEPIAHKQPVFVDETDADCAKVGKNIRELRAGSRSEHLSMAIHGVVRDHIGKLFADGEYVSNAAIRGDLDLTGWPVVAAHTCYGGYMLDNTVGDIGGLPGFLLSHGSDVVFAAPLKVTDREISELESYLCASARGDYYAIEEAYRNAVRADERAALYSLFSRTRAPKLIVATDEL